MGLVLRLLSLTLVSVGCLPWREVDVRSLSLILSFLSPQNWSWIVDSAGHREPAFTCFSATLLTRKSKTPHWVQQLPDNSWVLLSPFYDASSHLRVWNISRVFLGSSRQWSRSFSITIEKFLDYDRDFSRLRSRRFSITIEKILNYDREDSRKALPKVLDYSYREVLDREGYCWCFYTSLLYSILVCIGLIHCCYYMPLSFTTLRKWRERSPQSGRPQGLNSHPIAGLRPLALHQVPPPNPRIPHDRVSTLRLYSRLQTYLVPEFYYQSWYHNFILYRHLSPPCYRYLISSLPFS